MMNRKTKEKFLEKRLEAFNQYVRECLLFGTMGSFDEQSEMLKLFLKNEIDRIKKEENA